MLLITLFYLSHVLLGTIPLWLKGFSPATQNGLCGPFFSVFMIESLRIPYTWIALFGILYSITSLVFSVS